ncbi:MAG: methylenetetrahydrofolate reductase C-terminal domain-containing protein [Candidatus Omnitrophica bacterium]|nr:methylenetetrahydrofolate reductase C-terminal domain-containing protein [Candidatus Omnitrophota bacterium]
MIITKHKPFAEILSFLEGKERVFLIGCKLCATVCGTGGEAQMKALETELTGKGKTITGWSVLEPACSLIEVKKLFRARKDEINSSDAVLSFACGGGTQALAEGLAEKDIYPGNDTLFQGEVAEHSPRRSRFEQRCSTCGDCMLAVTGDLCPVTRCPKGLTNGPCGGVKNGKCEVDAELDCVWLLIYRRLKTLGRLEEMKKASAPKDHSKNKKPQRLTRG